MTDSDEVHPLDLATHALEVGRTYLGWLALPWTCVGFDAETGDGLFKFGQSGYVAEDAEITRWPRKTWMGMPMWTDRSQR